MAKMLRFGGPALPAEPRGDNGQPLYSTWYDHAKTGRQVSVRAGDEVPVEDVARGLGNDPEDYVRRGQAEIVDAAKALKEKPAP